MRGDSFIVLCMSRDPKLAATRCVAVITALALFAAMALANAGPFAVNEISPVPVSLTDAAPAAIPLASEFEQAVAPQLQPPTDVVAGYVMLLQGALDSAGVRIERPQFVALVDRSPKVQAVLLLWGSASTVWRLVGAAPVPTGLPSRYEHFATPLGVFEHSVNNPDYRAEGQRTSSASVATAARALVSTISAGRALRKGGAMAQSA